MKKRILTIIALLILIPTMIFATEVAITWEWMVDDPQVTGFRYQLNDENPDNWTVVGADTTMAVIQNLDGTMEYSLYLQQTFDGVNWSESSVSVAMPLFTAEESVVADEIVTPASAVEAVEEDVVMQADVAEEVVAPVEEVTPVEEVASVEEVTPVEEVAPVEEVTPVEEVALVENMEEETIKESNYYTSIGLNFGGVYNLNPITKSDSSSYSKYQPALNFELGFNNIVSPLRNVGLGLNVDVDLLGYVDGSVGFKEAAKTFFTKNTDFSLRLSLIPELEINTKHLVMDLGLIGDVTFVGNDSIIGLQAKLDPTFSWFKYGVFSYGAKAGLAYKFNNNLQYVVDGSIRKIGKFNISDGNWAINGFTGLKITY